MKGAVTFKDCSGCVVAGTFNAKNNHVGSSPVA
jgi:hypothetical protein